MDRTPTAPTGAPGEAENLPVPLRFHLPELGLSDAAAYLAYCREHGLPARLDKPLRTMRREATAVRRATAQAALARARKRQHPLKALATIARGELEPSIFDGTPLKQAAHAVACTPRKDGTRASFERSLRILGPKADFLVEPLYPDRTWRPLTHIVLLAHRLRRQWLRPIEDWQRRHRGARDACRDLIRHLFERYPAPPILWDAWYRRDARGATFRDWFLRAGRGESLRNLKGPTRITRRMAHHLPEAPVWMAIERGLRWAQARAVGIEPWLAEAFARSVAGGRFDEDPFWIDVMRWLARNPPRTRGDVLALVRYLREQRFLERRVVQPDGTDLREPPPRPHYAMRGRTLEALEREMDRWYGPEEEAETPQRWEPSGIGGLTWTRGEDRKTRIQWLLREIVTYDDLRQEARTMKHCVLDYADACARGSSSIWTLSRSQGPRARRIQTIEVDNKTKEIDQCYGRFNRRPSEEIRWVVRRWARQEGLALPNGF